MLSGADVNTTVQIGDQGIVFVDPPNEDTIPMMMDLIREHSIFPVVYVINTHLDEAHISGNSILSRMGVSANANIASFGPPSANQATAIAGSASGVTLLAHENVLNRFYLTEHDIEELQLTSTYFMESKDAYLNGEGVVIYHMPNAHTDGDSIVYFRRSDVISTGDIFTPGQYPSIDIARGGSVKGLVDALNFLIQLIVPGPMAEGGTYVVPGHGRIGDEIDVVEFRNMLYIVMQRVESWIDDGMSLQEIITARPTLDYDTEYGGHRGGPTSEEFITAIYTSLITSED
jgi:glyoxylase-like metal-dependent hydrolase (beta-lactamase superfamily II)